jgi:alkanesulfonate monooxygenase SsuD/methylene tetrahydromethanopterin reductase-like flavin-dependent oxidoreductase (luciferase family)
MRPRPANGTVPIVIGGHSKIAARRAATRGDGFFPGTASLEDLAAIFAYLRDEAAAQGRDPADITLYASAGGRPGPKLTERVERLAEIGVGHVVIPAFPADELTGIGEELTSQFT